MSDHPLIEALKKLETGLGDEAANHIATLEKRVKQLGRTKAAEQIESLQRENEELKAKLSDWEISPRGSQEIISIQADRIAELETRAITPEMRGRDVVLGDGKTAVSSISNEDEKWAGICLSAGGNGVGVSLPENIGKEDLDLDPFLRLICTSEASIDVLIEELQNAKASFRDLLNTGGER